MAAVDDAGQSTSYCPLDIKDVTTNGLFLLDTCSEVGAALQDPKNLTIAQARMLRAVNCTSILKYGCHTLTIDLGLISASRWIFIVAEVLHPAVTTPFGLFAFLRMPFGFNNAAQISRRFIY